MTTIGPSAPQTTPAKGLDYNTFLDKLTEALGKKYGLDLGQELNGAHKAPAVAAEKIDVPLFQGIKKSKEDPYLKDNGDVDHVKPAKAQQLTYAQRDTAEANGLFKADKNGIIVSQEGRSEADNDKLTAQLKRDKLITENGIDVTAAKEKYDKIKTETENNLGSKGIDAILAPAKDGEKPAKITDSNYKDFGLDAGFFGGLSDKGEKQLDALKRRGIVEKDGTINKNLNEEQKKYLESQKAANTYRDDIKDVSEGKVNVLTKQTDSADGDVYKKTNLDKNGNIQGFDKNSKLEATKSHDGTIATAKEQIKVGNLNNDQLKKIMTVGSDGNVTLDLSKLDAEEYKAMANSKDGIQYNGAGALTIKDNEGLDMKVNITGAANHVNLEGKASADITTKNNALEVNGGKDTKISSLQGDDLEQLVVNGGTLDSRLENTKKLEAVSLSNTTLTNGINLNNDKNDVVLNMSDSQVAEGKDVKVNSAKDATVNITNSKTGDVDVAAQKISTRLKGVEAGSVKIQAEKEAFAVFSDKTKAKEVTAKATDLTMSYLKDSEATKTDLSEVKGKTKLFVGNTSVVGALSLKKGASDKDVELSGNEDSAKDLEKATGLKARLHGDKTDKETISDKYFHLVFLGETSTQYDNNARIERENEIAAAQKAEYDQTKAEFLAATQPKPKKWSISDSLAIGRQASAGYEARLNRLG